MQACRKLTDAAERWFEEWQALGSATRWPLNPSLVGLTPLK